MKTPSANKPQMQTKTKLRSSSKRNMNTFKPLFGFVGIGLALMLGQVRAAVVVTDDFNRPNGALGANWTKLTPPFGTVGNWTIISNKAVNSTGGGAQGLDQYTGSGFSVGTGAYDVQANLWTPAANNSFVGVAFNIIDANNFYAVGVQRGGSGFYQFLQMQGGIFSQVSSGTSSFVGAGDLMKVSHSTLQADGVYTLTIGATSVTLTDNTAPFTGGGVGLYYAGNAAGGGVLQFDSFSATGVPEPSTYALLLMGVGGILIRFRRMRCRTDSLAPR
jgi:hypothetical protein